MVRRCQECSVLVGPEITTCPRCGTEISESQAIVRWLKMFVVALFLVSLGIGAPLTLIVWYLVDKAGYVMEWWMFLLTEAGFLLLVGAIVTMQRSRIKAEALDARLSMQMPAMKDIPPANDDESDDEEDGPGGDDEADDDAGGDDKD